MTVDPLHTVFSPYGFVQKMAIFEKNSTWQASTHWSVHMCAQAAASCQRPPHLQYKLCFLVLAEGTCCTTAFVMYMRSCISLTVSL